MVFGMADALYKGAAGGRAVLHGFFCKFAATRTAWLRSMVFAWGELLIFGVWRFLMIGLDFG
jgi:hypothetical protein